MSKKRYGWENKHIKNAQHHLVIREVQMKTMRCHYRPVKLAKSLNIR